MEVSTMSDMTEYTLYSLSPTWRKLREAVIRMISCFLPDNHLFITWNTFLYAPITILNIDMHGICPHEALHLYLIQNNIYVNSENQWIKLLLAVVAHCFGVLALALSALFLVQLSNNSPEKVAEDDSKASVPRVPLCYWLWPGTDLPAVTIWRVNHCSDFQMHKYFLTTTKNHYSMNMLNI